jgi:hypothetical protein
MSIQMGLFPSKKCQFILGVDACSEWIRTAGVPLFISDRRLKTKKKLPKSGSEWCLDSGGYSELTINGTWTQTAQAYAERVEKYQSEMGGLRWAAIQDWMCEPWVVEKTGLSIDEHQRRTIQSLIDLRTISCEINWIPVLQGWSMNDYVRHIAMYKAAGFDLTKESVVGIGSVCRRQRMNEASTIVHRITGEGLRLHGFGVKTTGLEKFADQLVSADSMAWSFTARRQSIRMDGCTHKKCHHCIKFALHWRAKVLEIPNVY